MNYFLALLRFQYGPNGKDFVTDICDMIKKGSLPLINGGNVSAGLVYIDNVANAIIKAAKSKKTLNKGLLNTITFINFCIAYNICDEDGNISWKEYANMLAGKVQYSNNFID